MLIVAAVVLLASAGWFLNFTLSPYPVTPEQIHAHYAYKTPDNLQWQQTKLEENYYEFTYKTFDGQTVNGRIKYPKTPSELAEPVPVLIGIHALGRSQIRWFQDSFKNRPTITHVDKITQQALKQGYAVIAIDARNHGLRKDLDYTIGDVMIDLHYFGRKDPYETMIRDNHQLGITEYALKGQLNFNDRHSITARYAQFEEDSHISETGLSEDEFFENPFQAPTGKIDRFVQQRDTVHMIHNFNIDEQATLSSQFYHVDNERASFRQINGPGEAIEYCPTVAGQPDLPGSRRALPATEENAQICGGRWRPRYYNYWGVEPRLSLNHQWLGTNSEAIIGARYHK
ncbi:hypothetical protein PULV_b0230 [Pseudoalteromonas ulvae UL12]|nr:hypothetical protein [Pseudoalteromonas ulvae UL12]